jgi:hypothetical protein
MYAHASERPSFTQGHKLVHAVERVIDRPEDVARLVRRLWRESPSFEALGDRIVSHYSNRSALVGGVSAVPAIIPGAGTLAVAFGTTLAEMAAVLKLEVEMCLALSSAHGFDIRDPRERQLAFLLAAVQTHEVASGRNVLLDVGAVSWTAVMSYTPRELEKLLLKICSVMTLAYASKVLAKGLMRSLPFVGIGIGAGVNKVMTTRVGNNARCWLGWRASGRRHAS